MILMTRWGYNYSVEKITKLIFHRDYVGGMWLECPKKYADYPGSPKMTLYVLGKTEILRKEKSA